MDHPSCAISTLVKSQCFFILVLICVRMPKGKYPLTRRQVLATGGVTTASMLAGCGGMDDGGAASQLEESDPLVAHERFGKGATTLTYQTSTFYTPITAESDQAAAVPALKTQHEAWAEANPDHHIDVSYPAFGEWKNNLLTSAAEGSALDGSTLDSKWVAEFYEYLQPLNEYVEDIDDFFPFVRETAMRDGDLLAAWKTPAVGVCTTDRTSSMRTTTAARRRHGRNCSRSAKISWKTRTWTHICSRQQPPSATCRTSGVPVAHS